MGWLSCRFRWQARGVAERGYGGDPPAYGFTVQKFGDDAENRFVENERPFR